VDGAFYIGSTGLDAQQRALDVVANNIANINTPAFKRSEARFSELVSGTPVDGDGPPRTNSHSDGLFGVTVTGSPPIFTEGDIQQTNQPLDVSIDGDGFFELAGPGGQTLLWRGGSLEVNPDGYLAAPNGMPLKAMISVPSDATSLTIGVDGTVQALESGSTTPVTIGQIDLVRDKDPSSLQVLSGELYQPASQSDLITAAPGTDGAGMLVPGAIENSNVQLSDELVNLLALQRAYSANAQVVQAGDQLMALANGLRR
jgi:flagellar basal-body rod protein FlgG